MESFMPLPPLPPSNTKRYWVVTQGPQTEHRTQVRVDASVTDSAALIALNADWTILAGVTSANYSITGLEVAQAGSDVRNPVPGWTPIVGTGPNIGGQQFARSFSIRGRSSDGRKMKMLLWGLTAGTQADFQLAASDMPAALTNFLASVNTRAGYYLTISGLKPVYQIDMLESYNDHWADEFRP
jgi:hypothetical protein